MVGVAGNLFDTEKKAFRWLLHFDAIRGEHSTGVASISDDGNDVVTLAKQVGEPAYLLGTDNNFKNNLWDGGTKCLIGHNRYATMGKITPENAHPFEHDGIVGAHNGTLEYSTLFRLENGYDFDVDSEAVFYNLSITDPKTVINELEGAYALVWYDRYDLKLKFIRNHERPLFYTRSKDRDAIFWASEKWMLEVALRKAGISHVDIESFDENYLYELDMTYCDMRFRQQNMIKGDKILGYKKPFGAYAYQSWHSDGYSATSVFKDLVKDGVAKNLSASSIESPAWDEAKMKKLVNTEIEFFIDGEWETDNKQKYLKASPAIYDDSYEIRLYGSHLPDYPLWKAVCTKYKARVKRAVDVDGAKYLLIDCRTVEEVVVKSQYNGVLDKEFYTGYDGQKITIEEWYKCTENGCEWCSSSVSPADDLMFVGHSQVICEQCKSDPEIMKNITPFVTKVA